MRIRELRAKAREDAQDKKWSLVWPMFAFTACIYLIGVIPELLVGGPAKAIVGLLASAGILFFSVSGSYAIMIRVLKTIRKEESSDFLADVFGEGMRNGWSCAWGIFKKIWYWVLLLVVGYALIIGGFVSLIGSNLDVALNAIRPETIELTNSNSEVFLCCTLGGFTLVILSCIAIMIASYKYYLVTYLKHDYPDRSTDELLEKSREMMDGNKAKAFVIPLTFIGWLLLAALLSGIVKAIFNGIWPTKELFDSTISSMPLWASIIMNLITYFIASFVTAYMQVTYGEFYLERNPQEIYNEDYVKPETNAPKYKKIIGWFYGIMIVLAIVIVVIVMAVLSYLGNITNNIDSSIYEFFNNLSGGY